MAPVTKEPVVVQPFNALTPAEAERLALLIEECAEVQHAATKILRHGYQSSNPLIGLSITPIGNRQRLEGELGHLLHAVHILLTAGDVDEQRMEDAGLKKKREIAQWLHHQ